jgi:hypothetical protein
VIGAMPGISITPGCGPVLSLDAGAGPGGGPAGCAPGGAGAPGGGVTAVTVVGKAEGGVV